jgi:UDP-N-acetylmuramoylalanine--D-glutamate ligase
MRKIFIQGSGITAKAVREKISQTSDQFQESNLEQADVVVISPGTKPCDWPQTSKPIISEIEFAFKYFCKNPVIAITGTNGKSTVTAMIAHALGIEPLGNIGKPFILANFSDPWHVVEVSSYQLESTQTFKPFISVVTNFGEDHLEWHGSYEHYHRSKTKIWANQNKSDYLVYNANDATLSGYVHAATHTNKIAYQEDSEFNENAMAALKALSLCGMAASDIRKAFSTYRALPHRMEKVAHSWGNVEIINDSKATNPESTCFALKQMQAPVLLILGGRDKNTSLVEMKAMIQKKVRLTYLFGEAAERFQNELAGIPMQRFETLQQVIAAAKKEIKPGEVLLFSPACASFDQFQNFEDRGRKFVGWINDVK